jgi:hypothetical protein
MQTYPRIHSPDGGARLSSGLDVVAAREMRLDVAERRKGG